MNAPALKRILVVDDEPDILTVTRLTLEKRGGFAVRTCESGEKAIEVVHDFAPDLILLDVMMPGMDGPATLRALREDPETSAIPVVFVTARSRPKEAATYKSLGAADVIAKPFDQRTLAETVAKIWRDHHAASPEVAGDETAALVRDYAARIPGRISEIEEMWVKLKEGEWQAEIAATLCERAHRLAGTGGTFGYPEVSDAAFTLEEEIEALAETGGPIPERSRARVDSLVRTLKRVAARNRSG